MTLKEFCAAYPGREMNIYVPQNYELYIYTADEYKDMLNKYGKYQVIYFNIDAYQDGDYSLNITLKK